MNRELFVEIDQASWQGSAIPRRIIALSGMRKVDVRLALIFTALATRPPITFGFHLSDLWAWLRYLPAIADSNELRLREEWDTSDPHQKAVLSDELGVGFTTQLFAEGLNWVGFADTLFLVQVLAPDEFRLLSSRRRGPLKSPDYVGWDDSGNYCVLECKGCQSSQRALSTQLSSGAAKKRNLASSRRLRYTLAAGLFIPQFWSRELPCIRIADPLWDEVASLLDNFSPDQIHASANQIFLAKQLFLSGLPAAARFFATTPTETLAEFPTYVRTELAAAEGMDVRRVLADSGTFMTSSNGEAISSPRQRFSALVPAALHEAIAESGSVAEVVLRFAAHNTQHMWTYRLRESFAELVTPHGFTYRLELY